MLRRLRIWWARWTGAPHPYSNPPNIAARVDELQRQAQRNYGTGGSVSQTIGMGHQQNSRPAQDPNTKNKS
jgi:hypothetical protein